MALLLSLLIATAFFFLSNIGIELMLENFTEKTGYINERSNHYLDDFASFVERDKVAANDLSKIKKWHKAHKGYWTLLYIVRNGEVLFDSLQYSRYYDPEESQHSGGATEEIEENYVKNEWFYNRDVSFADGSATVAFYGNFDVWLSTIALVGELILSVVLMCIVFALFIRKKINYIIELKKGVGVLETGGLSYPIPVRGKDELSGLADGLNQMRLALLETMQAQAEAAQTKYDLAVGVSHDLRTPLTAAALYLDLVAEDKYETEEQRDTYLRRCREKLLQIKQMTDRLFDRFSSEKSKPEPLPPQTVYAAFADVLSNTVSYLEENGITVYDDMLWPKRKIAVSSEAVNRIFDNISSNLLKYADRDEPVTLCVEERKGRLRITIENSVLKEKASDGTGIGLCNIESLMNKMNGSCEIVRHDNRFATVLWFVLSDEQDEMQKGKP
ncbi:MAG: HAMP domain-containing histidine kinase [Clostridia bacterium]|nr:HAMP domain-containing histidine kinase [Clostridia bacterium]